MARLKTKEEIEKLVPIMVRHAAPLNSRTPQEEFVIKVLMEYAFCGGNVVEKADRIIAGLKELDSKE